MTLAREQKERSNAGSARRAGVGSELGRDQEGAILVMGLFAAVLLVGFLYFVFGVGETLRHHERMQDAADAGAFSVAVIHADGMNLMALLNMVILSSESIVVALWAIIIGAIGAIVWIVSGGYYRWILYGWTIPFLVVVLVEAGDYLDTVSDNVDEIVDAAQNGREALENSLPVIAELKVKKIVKEAYGPPAQETFVYPPYQSLPVEEGSRFTFCFSPADWLQHALYWYALPIIYQAFSNVPTETVKGKARNYAYAAAAVLCMIPGWPAEEVHYEVDDDAKLGDENFQLRMFVSGDRLPDIGESGVRVAAYGQDPGGRIKDMRDKLSKLTFAQAEYYFDADEEQGELLWHMNWRARLRRFRIPIGQSLSQLSSACSQVAQGCDALAELLQVQDIVVH